MAGGFFLTIVVKAGRPNLRFFCFFANRIAGNPPPAQRTVMQTFSSAEVDPMRAIFGDPEVRFLCSPPLPQVSAADDVIRREKCGSSV